MKKINVEFPQDMADYLERLGHEVDSKIFLIDRIFANHSSDTDNSMFDSVPFKHYIHEYEEAYAAWELAKTEFQNQYLLPKVKEITGEEDRKFNWNIDDYHSLNCEVTIID